MPAALFIISWDNLEGAIITCKYPDDVDINMNNVQTIDVAHSFNKESPWIVVEEKGFKAVSFYNEALMRAIALALLPNEVPANFVKFLEQLAEFVLPHAEEEGITRRLQQAFSLVQAEIPATEVVLLNFANEIQQLKERALDTSIQIRGIMELASDLPTKILLYLLTSEEGATEGKIAEDLADMGHEKAQVMIALAGLLERKNVAFHEKDGRYVLTMLTKPDS
ncbi:MAG: hypothetical protein JW839_01895 [Candidatus Lokiarchaeota archaeon]|nr:hypothetical protein [Candidatus Lokiarchaeota archaeon]